MAAVLNSSLIVTLVQISRF